MKLVSGPVTSSSLQSMTSNHKNMDLLIATAYFRVSVLILF